MLVHIRYLAMTLVGPALFVAWLRTGPDPNHGFYNLFATFVILCTLYCAGSALMLWLREAQNKPWRFEKIRELLRSKTYITYFGFTLNAAMFLSLVWYGKTVIGGILLLHMILVLFIRHLYLSEPPHVQKPNRIDEDTERMPL